MFNFEQPFDAKPFDPNNPVDAMRAMFAATMISNKFFQICQACDAIFATAMQLRRLNRWLPDEFLPEDTFTNLMRRSLGMMVFITDQLTEEIQAGIENHEDRDRIVEELRTAGFDADADPFAGIRDQFDKMKDLINS